MNNSKITLALLITLTTLAVRSSEFYVPASETEFICHGRKPRNPLTTPLMGAIIKKHRSKQKLPRAKNFLNRTIENSTAQKLAA